MISAGLVVNFDLNKLKGKKEDAIEKGLEMAMFVWETEAKLLTTTENHVVTGRYRASLNRNRNDGLPHGAVAQKSKGGDGLHKKVSYKEFLGGSNVEYAEDLEKKYAIFARALDNGSDRMLELFTRTFIEKI